MDGSRTLERTDTNKEKSGRVEGLMRTLLPLYGDARNSGRIGQWKIRGYCFFHGLLCLLGLLIDPED
jgi:hypothetical protein